jgi:hypothetical protein
VWGGLSEKEAAKQTRSRSGRDQKQSCAVAVKLEQVLCDGFFLYFMI